MGWARPSPTRLLVQISNQLVLQAYVGSHTCYSVYVIKLPNAGKNGDLCSVLARDVADFWLGFWNFPHSSPAFSSSSSAFSSSFLLCSFGLCFFFNQVDLLSFSLPCFLLPLYFFFFFLLPPFFSHHPSLYL